MSDSLQAIANKIVKQLDLDTALQEIGEVHLVGNVALGTTVKPDIDYQIYASEDISKKASEISKILELRNIRNIQVRQLRLSHDKTLVTGRLNYNNLEWVIDISLTEPIDNYVLDGYKFYTDYIDKLSENKRETIVTLKRYFLNKGMLWNGMSYYIYRAVIDDNANRASEVFEYLRKNKINISRFKKGKND